MGLLNTSASASATLPGFEPDDTAVVEKAQPAAAVPAVAKTNAVSTQVGMVDVFAPLRDALRVEYNTLSQVKLTNGNFVERETNVTLGDTVVFDLLSFQDSFTITPNDDKAPIETIKFSDDGITCKDGTSVADHLANLKAEGYSKAGVKQRMVVVGAVLSASKTDKLNGSLVQFDLSPETRVLFERFRAITAYGVKVGKVDPTKGFSVKAVTRLVTKGSNTYTVADFQLAS